MLAGLDRTFLHVSSLMAEPFCSVYGLLRYRLVAPLDPKKFDNCVSQTREIAYRALIASSACFATYLCAVLPLPILGSIGILGVGSRIFRAIGFALQKDGYTHVRGHAPEKPLDRKMKVMNWNICGIGAGMHFDHGGVVHWRSRLDRIVSKIVHEEADVVVLQEVYDTSLAEALVARLSSKYAHFYMHLGPNTLGSGGGCMIMTKCAVDHFSHDSFENNQWTLNRGFGTLEIKAKPEDHKPCARIIGTHLIHGENQENRAKQFAQIVDSIRSKKLPMPTIIAGDLNIERDKKEGIKLAAVLRHSYRGRTPTCTSRLAEQWDKKLAGHEETIDYVSFFKEVVHKGSLLSVRDQIRVKDSYLIKAFDSSYNTRTALSDHQGIAVTFETSS